MPGGWRKSSWSFRQRGAKNLNLVTATQWLPWILPALRGARARGLTIPVAYNTGGYERVETVRALKGVVDIWLADLKYGSAALGAALSDAEDYNAVALQALRQMLVQTGAPQFDRDGYLQKGVIIRHLVLPGQVRDSLEVVRQMAQLRRETGVAFLSSFMSQFTPFYHAAEHGMGAPDHHLRVPPGSGGCHGCRPHRGLHAGEKQCPRGIHAAL